MDKIKKIKEWIYTRKLCTMDEHMKFYCKEAESDYNLLCSVEKILDSEKEEPVSEDLGDYINELSKQFPEVSFAKLSRIAVRVAKWQREQIKEAKDAIDGEIWEVEVDTCGCGLNSHTRLSIVVDDEELRKMGFKDGDKCKVVILKDTPEYIEGVKGSYTTTTK